MEGNIEEHEVAYLSSVVVGHVQGDFAKIELDHELTFPFLSITQRSLLSYKNSNSRIP
jgi:hypothetical protein